MKTKDGQLVTREMLDEWAAEFESGTWPEGTTKRGVGRPEEHGERMRSVTVRLPESQLVLLDKRAKDSGETRSDIMREAVGALLMQA